MGSDHYFGGGGGTALNPATLFLAAVAAILLFVLPRRHLFAAMLAATAIIPLSQQIVVGGIHLTVSRILIVLGWARLMALNQPPLKWNKLDRIFVFYCLSNALMYVLLWGGESGAIINRAGFLLNACGLYWFCRNVVRTETDVRRAVQSIVWTFVIIGVAMAAQQIAGRNVFSTLGGVPVESDVRNGKVRAQGPFVHPLTAGAIGSVMLPLAFGLWWTDKKYGRQRVLAAAGIAGSIAVGATSSSSTALLTLAAAIGGLCLWKIRRQLRTLRWTIVAILIGLHLVMKAPVWALIARIDLTGSSSGYHRYALVDQFIWRFPEWWLVGTQTTADWGWDTWDTINSYVSAGTNGGLITFLLFLAVLVAAFQELRRKRRRNPDRARQLWTLTSMLFAHAVAFFGIEYFDQSQFVWFASLALISSAVSTPDSPKVSESPSQTAGQDLRPAAECSPGRLLTQSQ